ncbi:MAG: hypothetical protein V4710_23210, partial [Verrucomicrobiota bacterium]
MHLRVIITPPNHVNLRNAITQAKQHAEKSASVGGATVHLLHQPAQMNPPPDPRDLPLHRAPAIKSKWIL